MGQEICHALLYKHEHKGFHCSVVSVQEMKEIQLQPLLLWTYMLFTSREVRIGKNCTRDRGHSFSQYGPTKAGE